MLFFFIYLKDNEKERKKNYITYTYYKYKDVKYVVICHKKKYQQPSPCSLTVIIYILKIIKWCNKSTIHFFLKIYLINEELLHIHKLL